MLPDTTIPEAKVPLIVPLWTISPFFTTNSCAIYISFFHYPKENSTISIQTDILLLLKYNVN